MLSLTRYHGCQYAHALGHLGVGTIGSIRIGNSSRFVLCHMFSLQLSKSSFLVWWLHILLRMISDELVFAFAEGS